MDRDRDQPTVRLIREALDEARELSRLEVALAREEALTELRQARSSAFVFGGSAAAVVASFTMCMVSIALALPVPWAAALAVAALLLCIGVALGLVAYKSMPKKPMAKTKGRIEDDLKQLKERRA